MLHVLYKWSYNFNSWIISFSLLTHIALFETKKLGKWQSWHLISYFHLCWWSLSQRLQCWMQVWLIWNLFLGNIKLDRCFGPLICIWGFLCIYMQISVLMCIYFIVWLYYEVLALSRFKYSLFLTITWYFE